MQTKEFENNMIPTFTDKSYNIEKKTKVDLRINSKAKYICSLFTLVVEYIVPLLTSKNTALL